MNKRYNYFHLISPKLKPTFYCLFFLVFFACTQNPPPTVEKTPEISQPTGGNPAINALTQKIKDAPNEPKLYAQRAKLYYDNEGYDEAIADLTKALSFDSTNVDYLHLLSDAHMDYYQSRKAIDVLQLAAKYHPTRIPTLLKLAELQMLVERYTPSLRTVDQILKIEAQNTDAYFLMGLNFRATGDKERAINSLQTVVENDPDYLDAWIILAQLFESLDNPIAIKYFNNALRVDSTNIAALTAKGNYLGNQGKFSEAIKVLKKIHRYAPQRSETFYNIGLAYLEMDSIEQAYKNFNIVVNTSPTDYMAYFCRGITLEQKGDIKAAKKDYQQALNLEPKFERAQIALANLNK